LAGFAACARERQIVITEDSDFGEWVFAHGAQAAGVIFLRYSHSEREQIQTSLASILENPPKSLEGHFVTVTTRKIRMRSLP
jgi:predicted nuclease of predicted toxin-antitoxin system